VLECLGARVLVCSLVLRECLDACVLAVYLYACVLMLICLCVCPCVYICARVLACYVCVFLCFCALALVFFCFMCSSADALRLCVLVRLCVCVCVCVCALAACSCAFRSHREIGFTYSLHELGPPRTPPGHHSAFVCVCVCVSFERLDELDKLIDQNRYASRLHTQQHRILERQTVQCEKNTWILLERLGLLF
jgi:hypothetical protein